MSAWEVEYQKNPRDSGLLEILDRDHGIEEPYWRPSIIETKNLNKSF